MSFELYIKNNLQFYAICRNPTNVGKYIYNPTKIGYNTVTTKAIVKPPDRVFVPL
jgi:hypothetical protein|nr:MAG TPA: hypothetical protein [Caudoviricetes sp.]